MFVNFTHLNENVFVSGADFVKSNNHIVYTTKFCDGGHDVSPFGLEGPNMAFYSPCCVKQQQPIKRRFYALNFLLAFVEV